MRENNGNLCKRKWLWKGRDQIHLTRPNKLHFLPAQWHNDDPIYPLWKDVWVIVVGMIAVGRLPHTMNNNKLSNETIQS